jgi:hypothetical protein
MIEYTISNDQFTDDPDAPPEGYILEALSQIENELSAKMVNMCKGNYSMNFWTDSARPHIVMCNAYELLNPDDDLDPSIKEHCYYFEIEGGNHVSG